MGNFPLLFFSSLFLCLTLLYFKRKWPDLDIVDIFIVFISLYFGIYPFIRGLFFEKGGLFDSANNNPWAVTLVYLQIILIIIIIRVAYRYLPDKITNYLKLKTLIEQCARVDTVVIFLLCGLLILFQSVSYFKYGVKSHILADAFAKIGKDLPYWFTSIRTIYNYLTLSVVIVLASKISLSKYRARYFWLASILLFLPLVAYFGRKAFVNAVVMAALIWLISNAKRLFHFKSLAVVSLCVLSFIIASDLYQTYRSNLQTVGVSFSQLQNPITAALNFSATFKNLKGRTGTWEFDYLVFDRQLKHQGKVTTDGKITLECFKSAIPRIFWPDKKFRSTPEVLVDTYNGKLDDANFGTNMFGIAQSDFGNFSMISVPLTILLMMILTSGLLKVTFNYPVFFWLLSVNLLNPLINIEENGPEIFFMLRNVIGIMAIFLSYVIIEKLIMNMKARGFAK